MDGNEEASGSIIQVKQQNSQKFSRIGETQNNYPVILINVKFEKSVCVCARALGGTHSEQSQQNMRYN